MTARNLVYFYTTDLKGKLTVRVGVELHRSESTVHILFKGEETVRSKFHVFPTLCGARLEA